METPFNFSEGDKPEAPQKSGNTIQLIDGRYNLVFDRVANENDYADEKGCVSGRNDWKALKLFFKLKQSIGRDKEIVFSETFTCDYDPMIKNDKGESKRESLVEMGTKKYKALCFCAGANLQDTDSLIGREISCMLKKGETGYMELDCGAVGQNWEGVVDKDANQLETSEDVKPSSTEAVSNFVDDDLPF